MDGAPSQPHHFMNDLAFLDGAPEHTRWQRPWEPNGYGASRKQQPPAQTLVSTLDASPAFPVFESVMSICNTAEDWSLASTAGVPLSEARQLAVIAATHARLSSCDSAASVFSSSSWAAVELEVGGTLQRAEHVADVEENPTDGGRVVGLSVQTAPRGGPVARLRSGGIAMSPGNRNKTSPRSEATRNSALRDQDTDASSTKYSPMSMVSPFSTFSGVSPFAGLRRGNSGFISDASPAAASESMRSSLCSSERSPLQHSVSMDLGLSEPAAAGPCGDGTTISIGLHDCLFRGQALDLAPPPLDLQADAVVISDLDMSQDHIDQIALRSVAPQLPPPFLPQCIIAPCDPNPELSVIALQPAQQQQQQPLVIDVVPAAPSSSPVVATRVSAPAPPVDLPLSAFHRPMSPKLLHGGGSGGGVGVPRTSPLPPTLSPHPVPAGTIRRSSYVLASCSLGSQPPLPDACMAPASVTTPAIVTAGVNSGSGGGTVVLCASPSSSRNNNYNVLLAAVTVPVVSLAGSSGGPVFQQPLHTPHVAPNAAVLHCARPLPDTATAITSAPGDFISAGNKYDGCDVTFVTTTLSQPRLPSPTDASCSAASSRRQTVGSTAATATETVTTTASAAATATTTMKNKTRLSKALASYQQYMPIHVPVWSGTVTASSAPVPAQPGATTEAVYSTFGTRMAADTDAIAMSSPRPSTSSPRVPTTTTGRRYTAPPASSQSPRQQQPQQPVAVFAQPHAPSQPKQQRQQHGHRTTPRRRHTTVLPAVVHAPQPSTSTHPSSVTSVLAIAAVYAPPPFAATPPAGAVPGRFVSSVAATAAASAPVPAGNGSTAFARRGRYIKFV